MKTTEFDFDSEDKRLLPHDPIQLRGGTRESGKMIVLDRASEAIEHKVFSDICDYFREGDLLVLNDSYMIANNLVFQSGDKTTQVSIRGHEEDGTTIVDVFDRSLTDVGTVLTSINDSNLTLKILDTVPGDLWKVKFEPFELLVSVLDEYGLRIDDTVNLKPSHWKASPEIYRSVYSKKPGSLEIPSAGLHFSQELLAQAAAKGVEFAYLTLHVGATEIFTIRHISEEEVENHKVRSEYFEVSERAAGQINQARAEGRRVIAVGTTVMRSLETQGIGKERPAPIEPHAGWTDLYIFPGFTFNVVDVLLTNLHQPRSSHIVLTAAFAGKDFVMRSYAEITERGIYEFDMYGDSMLIT